MLARCASGFGGLAASVMLSEWSSGATTAGTLQDQRAPTTAPHYPPKAHSVIFLYMDGGPSQIDTFDHKPLLAKYDGQDPRKAMGRLEPTQN